MTTNTLVTSADDVSAPARSTLRSVVRGAMYGGAVVAGTFLLLVSGALSESAAADATARDAPPVGAEVQRAKVPDASLLSAKVTAALAEASTLRDPSPSPDAVVDRAALIAEVLRSSGLPALSSAQLDEPARVSLPATGDPSASPVTLAAAAMEPAGVNQCNGTDNVGGQAVACDVTVTNNLDLATGLTSSSVQVKECHGAANATPTCTTTTTPSDRLTTAVKQCDGSGNGGGGTVDCHVHIVNNITGVAPAATPATVNQCNGAGTGGGTQPTVSCRPIGNTTNATIDQCNNSGNGGGATMRVRCTVTPSTETSSLPVTVDQCNGSGNGGGATVTCSTSITNNLIAAPAESSPPVVAPAPDVVTPPVVTPPVVTPPVVTPPVVTPPVVVPTGVVTPPGVLTLPGVVTPPVDAPVTPAVSPPAATPPVTTVAPVSSLDVPAPRLLPAVRNEHASSDTTPGSITVVKGRSLERGADIELARTGASHSDLLIASFFAFLAGALLRRLSAAQAFATAGAHIVYPVLGKK